MEVTRYILCVVLAAFVAFSVSCSKVDDIPSDSGGDEQKQEQEKTPDLQGKLVSYSLLAEQPLLDVAGNLFGDVLDDLNLGAISELIPDLIANSAVIKSYRIVYNTKGNRGEDLQLSGDVAFLVNGNNNAERTLESVSLFHPAFATSESRVTEYEQYAFPGRSIYNALVVYPLYQGVYKGREPQYIEDHPITVAELMLKARQGLDCELAALELVEALPLVRMDEDYYTENMGLSCGAGTALATHYLLENDFGWSLTNKKTIRLRSTYCCEGCYSYSDLLWRLLEKVDYDDSLDDFTSMEDFKPSCMMAVIIGAYDTWKGLPDGQGGTFFDGINDVREYFSDELLNGGKLVDDEGHPVSDIVEYFRSSQLDHHSRIFKRAGYLASDMINPAFVKEDGTLDETDKHISELVEALGCNDKVMSGWTPDAPLCIAHSTADEFVPFSQAEDVFGKLSNNGSNNKVIFKTVDNLGHTEGNQFFAIADLILSRHPVN